MSLFNKNTKNTLSVKTADGKNEFTTRKEMYNLTQNVNVADVKQYLMDEYNRAFEREKEIDTLTSRINELEKIEIKYNAMLIASEKTRERLLNSEERIKKLKGEIETLKENNRALKNTNNNIELNYRHHLNDLQKELQELHKQINKMSKEQEKTKKSSRKTKLEK